MSLTLLWLLFTVSSTANIAIYVTKHVSETRFFCRKKKVFLTELLEDFLGSSKSVNTTPMI